MTAVAEMPEASGGAIQGNVVATNSTFVANQSDAIVVSDLEPGMGEEQEPASNSSGGAISGGSVTAANCSFSENKSGAGTIMETDGSGKGGGGAIFVSTGTSTLMNCVFVKNTSGVRGGAIHCDTIADANGRSISIYNSTFMDNGVATGFRGAAVSCGGIVRLLNSIFWYSSPSIVGFEQSNLIHVIINGALRNSPENYPM
ncbi:MAG: hypothetical protein HC767_00445 [Akkermansiaceae bacterium]|nr:hypothetical protein [Akkermansiaceae bacterium]